MRILIIGATSAIARETARCFARDGARFVITGRDSERLARTARVVRESGAAAVSCVRFDVLETDRYDTLIRDAQRVLGGLDLVFIAHGMIPDQAACEQDGETLRTAMSVNAISIMALLMPAATALAAQGSGTIAVITSVAGQRGRRENYVYGSAKAAVSTFLQGLRARMHAAGVSVVDLRPGPVRTPMTAHKKGGRLFIEPERAGRLAHAAIVARKDVAYLPGWWRWIVAIAQVVPERVHKRLDLRAE